MGADYHSALEEYAAEQENLKHPETRVCVTCVLDADLWRRAGDDVVHATCAFCGQAQSCTTFHELAGVVESVVDEWYSTVAESGAYHDEGELSETTHDIKDIVDDILDGAVCANLFPVLSAYIADRDGTDYGWVKKSDLWATVYDFTASHWKSLAHKLKKAGEPRDSAATEHLPEETAGLLTEIRQVALLYDTFQMSSPALWRCRPWNTFPLVAKELGSPPLGRGNHGRMTTKGHSAFYGSKTLACAVREVSQGDDVPFAAGRFTPSREICNLDIFETPDRPSIFSEDGRERREALDFLDRFAETMSEPKYDDDPRHYAPTQVFVKFLLDGPETIRPEAIRFKSSLDGNDNEENWVVFDDNEHCVDKPRKTTELHLILDAGSAQRHPSSTDFLNGSS
ncbi:RES domain-containing protein [Amycolatopsis alba]|uniref:RES domain-containing protein n=1 Tax=Amycolatopsis alba DSM 44262 TaxID=1125972 RepID=A0A229S6E5_AMYAL|nr:RES domain-containing protein [Amycolatopsis alba]OXM54460.1 RES domain-containing protein [Amycolatopsis alba DSM 44262]